MERIPLPLAGPPIPQNAVPGAEKRAENIVLVQPRHLYAPALGVGHAYLPTSLHTVAARLEQVGISVQCQDGNLHPLELQNVEHIGVNLIGIPYVPEVRSQVMALLNPLQKLIVGGQVVSGIAKNTEHFHRMFGEEAVNGNNDAALAAQLGIAVEELPSAYQTSLVPIYEKLSPEDLHTYLVEKDREGNSRPREFSFFLSQGCKFACSFCGADHTLTAPGNIQKVSETYRDMDVVARDLDYLAAKICQYGVHALDMYLSNLDLFQTPHKLEEFAGVVTAVRKRHGNMPIGMRCLSTVSSFLDACRESPQSVRAICDAGLHTVGFGVDGTTPRIWRSIKKGHNRSPDDCIEAIRIAREEYGMTPEVLMVFGHKFENEEDLRMDEEFTIDMIKRYGAIPRPHVMKDLIPGNDYWKMPENAERIAFLLRHPQYMQALDLTATASSISHQNPLQRKQVNRHFVTIASQSDKSTKIIQSSDPEYTAEQMEEVRRNNEGLYDR